MVRVLVVLRGGYPWGFRMQGGGDKPLIVSKVTSTGKAGGAGVRAGCTVKAINGTPTAQLSLSHAHALTKQGSTLTLEIDDSDEPFGTSIRSTSNSSTSASTSSTVVAANGHISSAKRKGDSGSSSERHTEVRTEDSTSHTEKSEDSDTSVIILETHGADPELLRTDADQKEEGQDAALQDSPPQSNTEEPQTLPEAEKRFSLDSTETDEGDYAEIASQTDTSTDTLVFDVTQNELDATFTEEESTRSSNTEYDQATGAHIEYPNEASDDEYINRHPSEEDYSGDSFFVNFEEELEKVEQQYPELEARHLLSQEGSEETEAGVLWVCQVTSSNTCFTIDEEGEEEETQQTGKLDTTMGQYYSSASGGDPSRGDASGSLDSSPRSSEGWRMSMASTATVASSATANSDDTLAKDMSELSSVNSRLSYLDEAQDEIKVPPLNQNTDPDITPKEAPATDTARQTSIKDAIDELESIEQAAQTLLQRRHCSDDERATPVPGDTANLISRNEDIDISMQSKRINELDSSTVEITVNSNQKMDLKVSGEPTNKSENNSERNVNGDKSESSISPENVQKNDKSPKEEKASVTVSEEKPPLPPTAGSQPPKVEVKRRWFSRTKDIQPYISRESYNNDKVFKELERLRRSFQESDLNDFLDTLENTAIPDDMDEAFLRQLLLDIKEDVEGPAPLSEEAQLTEEADVSEAESVTPVPEAESPSEIAPRSKFEKVKERIMEMIRVRKKDKNKDGDDTETTKEDSLCNDSLKDDSSRSETPLISRSVTPQSMRPDTPDSKSSRPQTPDESKKGFNIAEFLKKGSPKYLRKKYKERKNRKSDLFSTSESESEDAEGFRKDVGYSNNSLSQKKINESQSSLKGSNRSLSASQELKKEVRFDLNTDGQRKGSDDSKDAKIESPKPIIVEEKLKESPRLSGPQMITCEAQQQETVVIKEFEETTQEMESDYVLTLPSTVEDINARAENLLPRLPERAKPPRRRKKLIPAPVEELTSDLQSETTSTTSVDSVKEVRVEGLKINAAIKDESPPPLPPYDEVAELQTCTPTYIQVVEATRQAETVVEETQEPPEIPEKPVTPLPPVSTCSPGGTVINEIIILNSENSASLTSTGETTDVFVDPIPVTSVATISVAPAPEKAVVVVYPPRTLPLPVIQESLNEDQVSLPTPSEPTLSFSTLASNPSTPREGEMNESFYDNTNPFAEYMDEEEVADTRIRRIESPIETPTKGSNIEIENKVEKTELEETINSEIDKTEKIEVQESNTQSESTQSSPKVSEVTVEEPPLESTFSKASEEEKEKESDKISPEETKLIDKVKEAKREAPKIDIEYLIEEIVEVKTEVSLLKEVKAEEEKEKQPLDSQQEARESPDLEKSEIADIDALAAMTAEMFNFTSDVDSTKTKKEVHVPEAVTSRKSRDVECDTSTQTATVVSETPRVEKKDMSTATETREMVTQTEDQEEPPRSMSVKEMVKSNTIAIQTDATRYVRMYEAASQTDTEYETDLETEPELEDTSATRYDASKWLFTPSSETKSGDPQIQELHKQQQMMIEELQQQQKQKTAPQVPPRQFQQKMPMRVVQELKSVLGENGEDPSPLKKVADPPPRWDSDLTWENGRLTSSPTNDAMETSKTLGTSTDASLYLADPQTLPASPSSSSSSSSFPGHITLSQNLSERAPTKSARDGRLDGRPSYSVSTDDLASIPEEAVEPCARAVGGGVDRREPHAVHAHPAGVSPHAQHSAAGASDHMQQASTAVSDAMQQISSPGDSSDTQQALGNDSNHMQEEADGVSNQMKERAAGFSHHMQLASSAKQRPSEAGQSAAGKDVPDGQASDQPLSTTRIRANVYPSFAPVPKLPKGKPPVPRPVRRLSDGQVTEDGYLSDPGARRGNGRHRQTPDRAKPPVQAQTEDRGYATDSEVVVRTEPKKTLLGTWTPFGQQGGHDPPPPPSSFSSTPAHALQELGLDESTLLNEIEQILGYGSLASKSQKTESHSNSLAQQERVSRSQNLGKAKGEEAPAVPGRDSSKGVWSPGRSEEREVSGPSKIDVPDLPSFKDQPTVWSPGRAGSASPSLGRKEYRKITYEGTLQKRPSQENISAPRPEESYAWKDGDIERALKSPTSTLPKVQNPTVTLLQKKRDGQIPGKRPEYLKGDDYGPAYKPEDKLYTIKREYESEDEEGSRRFAVLGPKKVQGVGPTTNDGVPTTLKSGVKSEHQGEWYRRMFDSLHKVKDDDHIIVKYKCPRARYGGYMSEPEGYDSDVGSSRYATLDRRRMHHFEADPMSSSLPRDYIDDWDPFFRNTNRYIHQPGRIEDYIPGHSSLSEKEQKKIPEAEVKPEAKSQEPPPVSVNHRFASQKMSMTHALKESGYESDSTLVFRKREDARRQPPDPRKTSQVYRQIQRGGDIPLTGLQKTAPNKPKEPLIGPLPFPYLAHQHPPRRPESPFKYEAGEINIHYRTPVRTEQKEAIPEEELARRQEEHMKKVYEQERRKKYLAELEDIERRRHTDNFTPLQKSPIPLNRYDDESSLGTLRGTRTPEPKQVAKALYNFTAQNKRELTFNKGDIIFIRRQIDKNWFEGELRGSVGIFPCNYVEIVPYDNMKTLTRKPTEGQARARFNFQAQTSMEMSLSKGELVVLTRRVDENWYEGRIGARKGIFPVSYVDTLVEPGSDRPLTPSSSPMPRPALPAANLLYNGASSYSSPYSTLGRPGSQNDSRPYNQSLTVNTQQEPVPYRALYNYKPQNDDELELLEGDVVLVMEKCDDGWFVGTSRRTGLFGTFPGNYVERI